MSVKVNGARLLWAGYEFGLKVDGAVELCASLEHARLKQDRRGGEVMFRSVYVSDWFDAVADMGFG